MALSREHLLQWRKAGGWREDGGREIEGVRGQQAGRATSRLHTPGETSKFPTQVKPSLAADLKRVVLHVNKKIKIQVLALNLVS